MSSTGNKVVVIGQGRFGSALAQGLREGFVEGRDGARARCNVTHLSATAFAALPAPAMADALRDAAVVAYCGTRLATHAGSVARALRAAGTPPPVEFLDFSNPDPVLERGDVSGTLDLWAALNAPDGDEEAGSDKVSRFRVWKVTEVRAADVSGITSNAEALLYGSHPGEHPRIALRNLSWKAAPHNADLAEEVRRRIMERAGIDCWYDANILGLAIFAFTTAYSILRYHANFNGKYSNSTIPMYLLDKACSWTALWMMVVAPFAGNLLALASFYGQWQRLDCGQKLVTLLCSLLMVLPVVLFSMCWVLWIIARNVYFMSRWPVTAMYLDQSPHQQQQSHKYWVKATLADMINLKGETGCTGFAYAFVHSFLGAIVCDPAYKGYWFDPETGRLKWNFELSMMTGAVATALLWMVTMRTVLGNTSWIRLKPLYAYVTPVGIWFAVVHVVAYGAKGWTKLFDTTSHNGQMSITWVSTMFPAGILLTHHILTLAGAKRACADDHLWKHSLVNIATKRFDIIVAGVGDLCPHPFLHDSVRERIKYVYAKSAPGESRSKMSTKSMTSSNDRDLDSSEQGFDNFVAHLKE